MGEGYLRRGQYFEQVVDGFIKIGFLYELEGDIVQAFKAYYTADSIRPTEQSQISLKRVQEKMAQEMKLSLEGIADIFPLPKAYSASVHHNDKGPVISRGDKL
ncbi:MAG: hypothetical protein KKE20_00235 [Nanoarchaeota archaeon]|nr:hypothetical protein [Nanoarchaeota archaeon]